MKFGKQLQIGTYEPWKSQYIQYSKLKRIILRRKFVLDLEADKREAERKAPSRQGSFASLRGTPTGLESKKPPSLLNLSLGLEMKPIAPQQQTMSETTPLTGKPPKPGKKEKKDKKEKDNSPTKAGNYEAVAGDESDEEMGGPDDGIDFFPVIREEIDKINKFYVGKLAEQRVLLEKFIRTRDNHYLSHHTSSSDPNQSLVLRDVYIDLITLKTYCELNTTGFYKIIKKYDKTMGESTLKSWMKTIDDQPFSKVINVVELIDIVTGLISRDKLMEWELFASNRNIQTDTSLFPSVRWSGLVVSILIFLTSLIMPLMYVDYDEGLFGAATAANRCMALLLFVISLWVTEAIPYFATALLVPILVTVLRVLRSNSDITVLMTAPDAANFVMGNIFNHTTMLLIGGYTISSAFSRCQLELRLAAVMQSYFGKRPKLFILAMMFVGLFLSMWISNHTSPILCATIILPIVRDLPSDSRFSKALLLGLAFACNFGGMMTPISSLQNVLAVANLQQHGYNISFGGWILVSLPFGIFLTLFAWFFLCFVIQPDDITAIPVIVYERKNVLTTRNIVVISLSLLTIVLFASFSYLQDTFGDIGIIALCFVTVMFGTGLLTEVDFNSLSWHTLFLVGGGNVLGKAIDSSGLLGIISSGITLALPMSQPNFAYFAILCFAITIATFISHTVASLILMPIIMAIGVELKMPVVVVVSTAFAVSAAMGLPFSSFPNVNSLLIVDDFQLSYLSTNDFLKTGVPMTVFTLLFIATLGAGLIVTILEGEPVESIL